MKRAVIVALDVENQESLQKILDQLGDPKKTTIKIGMELYFNLGNKIVKELAEKGYSIFLDLKLHDIPNTVYNGAKQLAKLGITYLTVHSLGGSRMIESARQGLVDGIQNGISIPKLLAVTELTSISDQILKNEQNCALPMNKQVISLAKTAKNAGADGIICSPLEVSQIKKEVGDDFLYITPGIRLNRTSNDDQERITTPSMAKEFGSSSIVVGRPILKAENPKATYELIKEEFE